MGNLSIIQKRLVNAYAILVLGNKEPDVPLELQEHVSIRVAEIVLEKTKLV